MTIKRPGRDSSPEPSDTSQRNAIFLPPNSGASLFRCCALGKTPSRDSLHSGVNEYLSTLYKVLGRTEIAMSIISYWHQLVAVMYAPRAVKLSSPARHINNHIIIIL